MAIPSWITSIFAHSIGEIADGLFTFRTAETTAADFGRGWGDEHQWEEILVKVDKKSVKAVVSYRPVWMDFLLWGYVDRGGFLEQQVAKSRLKKLRLFLTSWDKLTEKGTKTTTTDSKDKETSEKVVLVEKVFKPGTNHAVGFVARCVEIILETERLALAALPAGATVTEADKRNCQVRGYVELLRYFKAAQLPYMPAPGEKHWSTDTDTWIQDKLGADVKPLEIVKTGIILAGAGSLARQSRRQERMNKSWWPLKPFVFIYNMIA